MNEIAVFADGLGKQYRIGGQRVRYRTLRDTLVETFSAPFRRAAGLLRGEGSAADLRETIWALRDISFEIKRGEVVGIIGHNGAGKSTLLKILARITEPTEGYADIDVPVGSLLEIGTGFHAELTGRENIYLYSAILGMSRHYVDRKFDEIVSFAEVEKFIDTPLKHYSSGMQLRLAFAVAAHLEPDVLLVDEVLAVGDAAFQRKCLGRMGETAQSGRTVLFVSHNMRAVQDLCERVFWIDGGRLRMTGPAEEVIAAYLSAVSEGDLEHTHHKVQIKRVIFTNAAGEPTTAFHPGDDIHVQVHYHFAEPHRRPQFALTINSQTGPICTASTVQDGYTPDVIEGYGTIGCTFRSVPLLPQTYSIKLGIFSDNLWEHWFSPQDVATFHVVGAPGDFGLAGERANMTTPGSAPLVLPYTWHLPGGGDVDVQVEPRDPFA